MDNNEGLFGVGGRYGGHIGLGELDISRAQALLFFLHVAMEGLSRSGAVLSGVLVGDTSP